MKKVAVFVCSRPNYGRLKAVLAAVRDHPDLELQLYVGISASYEHYECLSTIVKDGFEITEEIKLTGQLLDDERKMPILYGMFSAQLSDIFYRNRPDVVLIHADRFEMEAIAFVADCMNVPIVAHTQGGEITGSIDDDVRWSITMHSDYHFAATEQSAKRVESALRVRNKSIGHIYNVGCPSIDLIQNMDLSYSPVDGDYIVVLNHSNTREYSIAAMQTTSLLDSVKKLGYKTIWIGNNIDVGTLAIDEVKCKNNTNNINFIDSFTPEDFYRVVKHSKCLVGNTSSGIREGAFLGIPYLCLGTRQTDREHGGNVLFAKYDTDEICEGIEGLYGAEFEPDYRFGNGTAGKQIADILGGM